MQCSHSGVCRCTEGFKEDGIRCSKCEYSKKHLSVYRSNFGEILTYTITYPVFHNSFNVNSSNTRCGISSDVIPLIFS